MNADAFDRFARSSARRGTRRAVLALMAALPFAFARSRPASAQVCAPIGGLCTASYGCCDGTPCPMNLTAWVGICTGATASAATSTSTATQKTGRVPDDGNALGNRAKMRHRRRRHRDRKQKRRKKR